MGCGGSKTDDGDEGKPKDQISTQLSVQIRKRATDLAIWEGRATTQAKDGTPASQPGIAAASSAFAEEFCTFGVSRRASGGLPIAG